MVVVAKTSPNSGSVIVTVAVSLQPARLVATTLYVPAFKVFAESAV